MWISPVFAICTTKANAMLILCCVVVVYLFVWYLKNGRNRIKVEWNQMGKINDNTEPTKKKSHKTITFTFMRVLWMNCVHWTHGNISEHTMAHKPAIKWIENFVSAFFFCYYCCRRRRYWGSNNNKPNKISSYKWKYENVNTNFRTNNSAGMVRHWMLLSFIFGSFLMKLH